MGGPYKAELFRAVEAAYDVCGRGHFSAALEVCLCPVCMTDEARAVLDDWARAMTWHFAWADTTGDGSLYTPPALLETLLCGGWPLDVLTGAREHVFADPQLGQNTLSFLVEAAMRRARRKHGRLAPDWYALRYCSEAEREGLIAWLNAVARLERVLALATEPGRAEGALWLHSFAAAAGQFDAALLPARD
jgi:hypothetical protein